ncbi:hypothetical protein [Actinoplanes sp. NPDC026670]|uniref:mechanosensitive ion channel family protein n=1 Tax=Actinoplanes sp. NPDC026670 TaxID=3154700 RepID=UPI0033C71B14
MTGDGLTRSLNDMWRSVVLYLPTVLVSLLILIAGYLLARLARTLTAKALRRAGFDRVVQSGPAGRLLRPGTPSVTDVCARLVFFVVLLFALQASFGVWGPNPASDLITALISWLPQVLVAIVIVVVTAAIARAAHDLVLAVLGGLAYARVLAKAAAAVIVTLGVIAGLDQIGIATSVTRPLLITILATVAGVIIVGVGGGLIRPMQQRWEGWLDRAAAESAVIRNQARAYAEERSRQAASPQPGSPEAAPRSDAPAPGPSAPTDPSPTGRPAPTGLASTGPASTGSALTGSGPAGSVAADSGPNGPGLVGSGPAGSGSDLPGRDPDEDVAGQDADKTEFLLPQSGPAMADRAAGNADAGRIAGEPGEAGSPSAAAGRSPFVAGGGSPSAVGASDGVGSPSAPGDAGLPSAAGGRLAEDRRRAAEARRAGEADLAAEVHRADEERLADQGGAIVAGAAEPAEPLESAGSENRAVPFDDGTASDQTAVTGSEYPEEGADWAWETRWAEEERRNREADSDETQVIVAPVDDRPHMIPGFDRYDEPPADAGNPTEDDTVFVRAGASETTLLTPGVRPSRPTPEPGSGSEPTADLTDEPTTFLSPGGVAAASAAEEEPTTFLTPGGVGAASADGNESTVSQAGSDEPTTSIITRGADIGDDPTVPDVGRADDPAVGGDDDPTVERPRPGRSQA